MDINRSELPALTTVLHQLPLPAVASRARTRLLKHLEDAYNHSTETTLDITVDKSELKLVYEALMQLSCELSGDHATVYDQLMTLIETELESEVTL